MSDRDLRGMLYSWVTPMNVLLILHEIRLVENASPISKLSLLFSLIVWELIFNSHTLRQAVTCICNVIYIYPNIRLRPK